MMRRSRCHLVVSRLPPPDASVANLSALQLLLSKGRLQRIPLAAEHVLCQTFGVDPQHQSWPLAPVSLLGDGVEPAASAWMRVDPVHYRLQRDSFLLDLPRPPLTDDDAQQLVGALNRHFEGRGMLFVAPHPQRWYVRIDQAPALKTVPLSQALGNDVDACAPQGQDAALWRSLINEAQMLLHEHPVNLRREASGRLPVNSLWPDGGGRLPSRLKRRFDLVWSDGALARGLARLSGVECRSAAAFLSEDGEVENHLLAPEVKDWAQLESDYLLPLLRGLCFGRWGLLTLDFGGRGAVLHCEIRRRDLLKFWRRSVRPERYLD